MQHTPPQNPEAEERVVGAIISSGELNGHTIAAVAETGLKATDFYKTSLGWIYDAALTVAEGDPTDIVCLADELASHGRLEQIGGKTALAELASLVPATANAPAWARRIIDAARRRELARAALDLSNAACTDEGASDAQRARLRELLAQDARDAATGIAGSIHELDIAQLLDQEPDPPDWVWHGRVAKGTVSLLHGAGGLAKSLMTLALATAGGNNASFLGRPAQLDRALILDGENPASEIHRRLHGFSITAPAPWLRYARVDTPILGGREGSGIDDAEELLLDLIGDNTDLLVLDSQRALWAGSERDELEVRALYLMLSRVAEAAHVAIVVVHHDNRGGEYSGSSDLNASVTSRLHLTWVKDPGGTRRLTHEKCRIGPELQPLEFDLTFDQGYVFTPTKGDTPNLTPNQQAAAKFVTSNGSARTREIARHVQVHDRSVRRWRDQLASVGVRSDNDGNFWTPGNRPNGPRTR